MLHIEYECPICEFEWEDNYECAVDSACPCCGLKGVEAARWEETGRTVRNRKRREQRILALKILCGLMGLLTLFVWAWIVLRLIGSAVAVVLG